MTKAISKAAARSKIKRYKVEFEMVDKCPPSYCFFSLKDIRTLAKQGMTEFGLMPRSIKVRRIPDRIVLLPRSVKK